MAIFGKAYTRKVTVDRKTNTSSVLYNLFTFNPFPNRLFQTERICRRQFQTRWEKNTVRKGEIARYEQFLLFPQCFQKTCTADT